MNAEKIHRKGKHTLKYNFTSVSCASTSRYVCEGLSLCNFESSKSQAKGVNTLENKQITNEIDI